MSQSDEGNEIDTAGLLALTAGVVEAYVGKNNVAANDLPGLIRTIHDALGGLTALSATAMPETVKKPTPGTIRKSITREALISFEDGRGYKTLKRHLTKHGLTMADYKVKWGLPADYPSTAPDYSARRSAMAIKLGLGRKVSAAKTPTGRRPTIKSGGKPSSRVTLTMP